MVPKIPEALSFGVAGWPGGGESRAVRELGLFVPALPQKHIGVARPTGVAGDKHVAIAFRIDPASGALQPHDQPQALPSRPINISVDGAGEFLLTAYNNPSNVTVHRINSDGTIGDIVNQPVKPDAGIYAHQVRTTPSNQTSILVTRGNNPAGGKPEDPGTLKVFGFNKGVLTNPASIAPGNGLGFGPRHLDFHPTSPGSLSRSSARTSFTCTSQADGGLDRDPLFVKDTFADPSENERPEGGRAAKWRRALQRDCEQAAHRCP
jgi:6-phosphogluconolactonase